MYVPDNIACIQKLVRVYPELKHKGRLVGHYLVIAAPADRHDDAAVSKYAVYISLVLGGITVIPHKIKAVLKIQKILSINRFCKFHRMDKIVNIHA